MHAPDQRTDGWRKSTYSATDNGCVEVAWQAPAALVRDSKDPATGTLTPQRPAWHTLLHSLR